MRVGDRLASILWPVGTTLGIVLLWELGVRLYRVPEFVLPAPSSVLAQVWLDRGRLLTNAVVTLWAVLAGFALSIAIGVPIALGTVYSERLERMIYPLLVFSQTLPKISIIPVLVVWFGFGLLPKLLIAFLVCFFPVVIDTAVGLRSIRPEMADLIRSMGGSKREVFLRVRIPSALPYFFSGLKVAVTLALVGAVVGEFVGSTSGLGFLIVQAGGLLNNRLVFAGIVVLSIMGIVLFYLVALIERLVLPWHVTRRSDFTP